MCMERNAIEGARYYDSLVDDYFVITSVETDENEPSDSDIDVRVRYDDLGETGINYHQFRKETSSGRIRLESVPA